MDYNFTDPANFYGNIPFDQANYTSSVCILENYQQLAAADDRLTLALAVMTFFLVLNALVETIAYLQRRRINK